MELKRTDQEIRILKWEWTSPDTAEMNLSLTCASGRGSLSLSRGGAATPWLVLEGSLPWLAEQLLDWSRLMRSASEQVSLIDCARSSEGTDP